MHDASGERSTFSGSPRTRWLVIVPGGTEEYPLETKLRERLADAHFAISDVSGGQTLLELPPARGPESC